MAQQGRRPARLSARGRRGAGEDDYPDRGDSRPSRDRWSAPDDYYDDPGEDLPPWAGPGIYPAGPGRRERRPPEPEETGPEPGSGERTGGRAAAARARRSRRRIFTLGGLAVVVILVVLAILGKLPFQGGTTAVAPRSDLVTTFQPGDVRSVPSACQAVSASSLTQYLPGKLTRAITQSSRMQSQCTWTLDARPVYRVLEVTVQAYGPSLLASGNGSATNSAADGYGTLLQAMKDPPKSAHRPKARLGAPAGLGNAAFSALQVWHSAGSKTYFVTVVARQRNVVVTITLQGLDGRGYGPVSVTTLQAGALALAHQAVAKAS